MKNLTSRNQSNQVEVGKLFFTYSDIGRAIQKLLKKLYPHKFTRRPFSKINFERNPVNKKKFNQIEKIISQTDEYGRLHKGMLTSSLYYNLQNLDLEEKCENPEHELFVFCILLKRPLMAELFLEKGTNQIISYLIGSRIFKSYSLEFENEYEEFDALAKEFEQSAAKLVKIASESNSEYAKILLLRQVPEFGRATCLQVAKEGYNIHFLSCPCVQEFMEKIWYNKISPNFSIPRVRNILFFNYTLKIFLSIYSI